MSQQALTSSQHWSQHHVNTGLNIISTQVLNSWHHKSLTSCHQRSRLHASTGLSLLSYVETDLDLTHQVNEVLATLRDVLFSWFTLRTF